MSNPRSFLLPEFCICRIVSFLSLWFEMKDTEMLVLMRWPIWMRSLKLVEARGIEYRVMVIYFFNTYSLVLTWMVCAMNNITPVSEHRPVYIQKWCSLSIHVPCLQESELPNVKSKAYVFKISWPDIHIYICVTVHQGPPFLRHKSYLIRRPTNPYMNTRHKKGLRF